LREVQSSPIDSRLFSDLLLPNSWPKNTPLPIEQSLGGFTTSDLVTSDGDRQRDRFKARKYTEHGVKIYNYDAILEHIYLGRASDPKIQARSILIAFRDDYKVSEIQTL